jgi:hypothetical protein
MEIGKSSLYKQPESFKHRYKGDLMKNIIFAVIGFMALSARADVTTADRIDYMITLDQTVSGAELQTCVKEICKLSQSHGYGSCSYLQNIGIVTANLDSYAAGKVSELSCVLGLEQSGEVEQDPSVGRSN